MEPDLLQSFRQEFQCFTEEELEEAVRTARREIQGELEQYEVYQTDKIISEPKRIVNVTTDFHQLPRDYSDEEEDDIGDTATAETGSSVSEDNTTVSLSVSEQIHPKPNAEKSRLSYSLDQLDQIFADIFKSINVNKNYVAKDSLESERANKRVKDFSARFGRTLYQTKQNFISFKNLVLRSQLAGQAQPSPARLEGRLAQLFISCRSLLTSYLTFIPLSGGQIFPPLLSDALELILDIANLTVSLGWCQCILEVFTWNYNVICDSRILHEQSSRWYPAVRVSDVGEKPARRCHQAGDSQQSGGNNLRSSR